MARQIRRILYATDFSKASARALDEAVRLAKQNHAELLVVHVIEPVGQYAAGEDFGGAELYMKIEEAAEQDAQRSMQKLMRKLQQARVKAKSLLLKGLAYEQIVKTARSRKANIIVIGTHGRTGLSKLFMGSVAGRVVSLASCPVLTVRGK
ncbi:MAG TPA: universal stress protein [Candidatus Binatia bacterium]